MNTPWTRAQQDQQHNRDVAGRYQTRPHAEADTRLEQKALAQVQQAGAEYRQQVHQMPDLRLAREIRETQNDYQNSGGAICAPRDEYVKRAKTRHRSASDQQLITQVQTRADNPGRRVDPVDGLDDQAAAAVLARRHPDADRARRDWLQHASPAARRKDPDGVKAFLAHIAKHSGQPATSRSGRRDGGSRA